MCFHVPILGESIFRKFEPSDAVFNWTNISAHTIGQSLHERWGHPTVNKTGRAFAPRNLQSCSGWEGSVTLLRFFSLYRPKCWEIWKGGVGCVCYEMALWGPQLRSLGNQGATVGELQTSPAQMNLYWIALGIQMEDEVVVAWAWPSQKSGPLWPLSHWHDLQVLCFSYPSTTSNSPLKQGLCLFFCNCTEINEDS